MSFDETKPPNNSLLISADHRANFLATRRALAAINMLQDPLFECWNINDATVPGSWNFSAGGGSIARDTTLARLGVGSMGARVTFGVGLAELFQDVLDAASYDQFHDVRTVVGGVFVHADTIGIARVRIDDGASFQDSSANAFANPATPEFLPVEYEVNPAATRLRLILRTEAAGNVTFTGAVFLFSDIRPDRFLYPITLPVSIAFSNPGPSAVFTFPMRKRIKRPFILENLTVDAGTGPVGGAETLELLSPNGAGGLNVAGAITLPATATQAAAAAAPASYNFRCFAPDLSASNVVPVQASRLSARITAIAPTPSQNVSLEGFGRAWARPQELLIHGLNGLK